MEGQRCAEYGSLYAFLDTGNFLFPSFLPARLPCLVACCNLPCAPQASAMCQVQYFPCHYGDHHPWMILKVASIYLALCLTLTTALEVWPFSCLYLQRPRCVTSCPALLATSMLFASHLHRCFASDILLVGWDLWGCWHLFLTKLG